MPIPSIRKSTNRCELTFTDRAERVILCPGEYRPAADYTSWIIGFRGHMPEITHRGIAARWVCRFWRIDPLVPGKDGAMTALLERATLYGFERIEVFDIEPPPTRPKQREVHELNERFLPLIREFNDAIQSIEVAAPPG